MAWSWQRLRIALLGVFLVAPRARLRAAVATACEGWRRRPTLQGAFALLARAGP